MILFKLAFKEIFNTPKFSLFFIFNLMLGLIGFIALDSFKLSIHTHISNHSKSILAADIDVSSYWELTPADQKWLDQLLRQNTGKSHQIEFMTMVSTPTNSRLVEVIAVDKFYPLYGQFVLKGQSSTKNQASPTSISNSDIWVQPELLPVLGAKFGDPITIGKLNIKIGGILTDAPGNSFWSAGITQKVFIGLEHLTETGLIKFGSRRRYHYLYRLPEGSDLQAIKKQLETQITKKFGTSPSIFVRTHQDAVQQTSRLLGYLNDYLGLVALVALFLAGIGTYYLFRNYLSDNIKEIAILMTLGASRLQTYGIFLFCISLLGTISAIIASVSSIGVLPLINFVLADFLPVGFKAALSIKSIFMAILIGLLGSLVFCLPTLNKISHIKPTVLLQNSTAQNGVSTHFSLMGVLSYLPIAFTFWGLSIWQSNSFIIGSLFTGFLILSCLIIALTGDLLLRMTGVFITSPFPIFNLSLKNLYRNRTDVLTSFLAIALGALLINLIPQLHNGLKQELTQPKKTTLPTLFLFDIQPEQVEPLKQFAVEKGKELRNISPMIRARLTHINQKLYSSFNEKKALTREQSRDQYMRRRGQNLSYRQNLYDTEKLEAGRPFSGIYDFDSEDLPEISLESKFASRIGVGVGDTLTFDVQGTPVEGKVVNLRQVRWNNFQPNFFILFQPGVLEYAPATFLGTVYQLAQKDKAIFQSELIHRFSNISVIDVTTLIKKILGMTEQINWALRAMAVFSIFAGIVVVYSISRQNAHQRRDEINLLKILGAGFNEIRVMILFEFGFLGICAATFGSLLSLAISWILSLLMFDRIWNVSWEITLFTIVLICFLTLITAYLGVRNILKQKPASLLQAV